MELIDRSFDLLHTINYTLSIRAFQDGFCFIVFDKKDNRILYFLTVEEKAKTPSQSLSAVIDRYPALQKPYEKILWVYDTFFYTLLPAFLHEKENTEKYWNLAFGENDRDKYVLLTDQLSWTEIISVYSVPKELLGQIHNIYPSARIINQQSIHILTSILENKKNNRIQVYIEVLPDFFDAVVMEKGKMLLANSYKYRNTDEFLYFILNLYEQFNLDQYEAGIMLSGAISEQDEKTVKLKKYISSVNIKKVYSNISGIKYDKIEHPEQFTNFLNIPLCGL
jgi:hypothetical protein